MAKLYKHNWFLNGEKLGKIERTKITACRHYLQFYLANTHLTTSHSQKKLIWPNPIICFALLCGVQMSCTCYTEIGKNSQEAQFAIISMISHSLSWLVSNESNFPPSWSCLVSWITFNFRLELNFFSSSTVSCRWTLGIFPLSCKIDSKGIKKKKRRFQMIPCISLYLHLFTVLQILSINGSL